MWPSLHKSNAIYRGSLNCKAGCPPIPEWNIIQGHSNACMIVSAAHLLKIVYGDEYPILPWRDIQRLTNAGQGIATYDDLQTILLTFCEVNENITSTSGSEDYNPKERFNWLKGIPFVTIEGEAAATKAEELLDENRPFCYGYDGHAYCAYVLKSDDSNTVCALNSSGGMTGTGLSRRCPMSISKKTALLSHAEKGGIMYIEN